MKKILSLLLISLCTALAAAEMPISAAEPAELEAAQTLYQLGLMKGNAASFSAESMKLDDIATRAEVAVTVTRMLGKEAKAFAQSHPHPFTDVPDWASVHVGYLYENYLVNGTDPTRFGSEEKASRKQFCAMLARVLGYSEAKGDFTYDDAVSFAFSHGFCGENADGELTRGSMASMCLSTLKTKKKLSLYTLAENLAEQKVISEDDLVRYALGKPQNGQTMLENYFASAEWMPFLPQASWSDNGTDLLVTFRKPVEEYGIRVYYVSEACPTPTQLPLNGDSRGFHKGEIAYPGGGAGGYVEQLELYGLQNEKELYLVMIKASSEGSNFMILGRSDVLVVPEREA